jgi:hypothetical protein
MAEGAFHGFLDFFILGGELEDAEEVFVGFAVIGGAFERGEDTVDEVLDDLDGRNDDECAQGGSTDDDQFGQVHQGGDVAAGRDETSKDRTQDDNGTDNDNHGVSLVLVRRQGSRLRDPVV